MTGSVHRLPVALVELLAFDLGGRAACAGLAPTFDDEVPGEIGEEREARLNRAAAICHRCPVLAACDRSRLDLGKRVDGCWAGHLPADLTTTRRSA